MKGNKTYILLGVFNVLVVAAYFLTADRGEKTATYKIEQKIINVDSASVDKLEIEQKGVKLVLVKAGIEWRISQPVDYTANQQSVASALHTLKVYKLESKVSDNPNNKDKYGFNDTNITKLTVYQNGNPVGTMMIGNAAGGQSQAYVKRLDGNEIYLASDFQHIDFVKFDIKDWRDKSIASINRQFIKSIEFNLKDENYKIEKDSSGAFFIGKDSVNKTTMDGILNLLQNFNTEGFKDTTLASGVKFDNVVKVNADRVFEYSFLKIGEAPAIKYILKASDKSLLFEVSEGFMKNLVKPKKELLTGKPN